MKGSTLKSSDTFKLFFNTEHSKFLEVLSVKIAKYCCMCRKGV